MLLKYMHLYYYYKLICLNNNINILFFIFFLFCFLEWRNFCINSLKYITEQPSDLKYLIPSLITHNTKRLLNIYEFELRTTDDLSEVYVIQFR